MKHGQRAYVLHRRPYRETSAIVELFTEHSGRVAVVARGLQRPRSGLAALCQPLQALAVSWTGRSELKTLRSIERVSNTTMPRGESLFSVLYCNELLVRLLPYSDPHPALFEAYASLLDRVCDVARLEVVLRQFELRLLSELGFALELHRLADSGAPVEPQGRYRFVAEQGLVPAGEDDGGQVYPGASLLAMHAGDYDEPGTRRCAKLLLRQALQPLLGSRPVASRDLFR